MKRRHKQKDNGYLVDEYGRIKNNNVRRMSKTTTDIIDMMNMVELLNMISDSDDENDEDEVVEDENVVE